MINVWAGIVGDCVVSPYDVPQRLTGTVYGCFLLHSLSRLLENGLLAVRAWFMHEGAPAHFSQSVEAVLHNAYHDNRIDRAEPVAWPRRSPDLTPLDFYLWGHIKTLVYSDPIENEKTHYHPNFYACQATCNRPGTFER